MNRHPGLRIDLLMSDQRQELLTEGVDVALRFGSLPDSTAVARRISAWPRVLVAVPACGVRLLISCVLRRTPGPSSKISWPPLLLPRYERVRNRALRLPASQNCAHRPRHLGKMDHWIVDCRPEARDRGRARLACCDTVRAARRHVNQTNPCGAHLGEYGA
jgi:DNA-binding transcriptional LysR family regulator